MRWPWKRRPAPPTRDTTDQARRVHEVVKSQRREVDRLAANADDYRAAVENVLRNRT